MNYNHNEVCSVEREDESVQGDIKGHKVILGMFSPVFKGEFFGPAKEIKDIIPVRHTTFYLSEGCRLGGSFCLVVV